MNITKPPSNLAKKRSQRGNALFIILIGIGLFAALSYAVSQMLNGGGGAGSVTKETAALQASEILDYARAVRDAVRDLQISNGCAAEDISFENPAVAGYAHSPAVADTCKVFNPAGGGLNWISASNGKVYEYSGNRYIYDIGTTGMDPASRADLYMLLEVDDETCKLINDKLQVENPSGSPPNIDAHDNTKFTGIYGGGNSVNHSNYADGLAATRGKYAFCSNEAGGSGTKRFLQVLIAR